MNMIADPAASPKALLYLYYPDKEAILFDILPAHLVGFSRSGRILQCVPKARSEPEGPR